MAQIPTDVLIIGAGPSGYMAAVTLARYGIDFRIIDKKPLPVQTGHASGLQPRSQEIYHTLGIVDQLTKKAGQVRETAFWGPAKAQGGRSPSSDNDDSKDHERSSRIQRTRVGIEVTNATPYPRICVNHQGQVESALDSELSKRGLSVDRLKKMLHYEYQNDSEYPIRAHVKDLNTGAVLVWQCKYLLGADGASSVSRTVAGIQSQINDAEDSWAVADAQVETDFPDFRRRSAIQTPNGNIMLIPSPANTIRIYMLLSKGDVEEIERSSFESSPRSEMVRSDNTTTLLDILERRIPSIMHPYKLSITKVDWISHYRVSQRIIENFSDGRRVFLLGDSCHTHSPKAAQGANIGMQDSYNLTWKLALALKGHAKLPEILTTYNDERKHIAQQLIYFDTKFAKMFASSKTPNPPEFHDLWEESHGFTSGCGHQYPPGLLVNWDVSVSISDHAVEPLTPGKRLLPMNLIRHIDGWQINLLDDMPSNGRFHLLIFAGDIQRHEREFADVYKSVCAPSSVLYRYSTRPDLEAEREWDYEDVITTSARNTDKVVDLYVVHTSDHLEIQLVPMYRQWKYRFYEDTGGVEHERHGVTAGADMTVVLVRPDGMVGMVCGVGELDMVEEWMDRFMIKGQARP